MSSLSYNENGGATADILERSSPASYRRVHSPHPYHLDSVKRLSTGADSGYDSAIAPSPSLSSVRKNYLHQQQILTNRQARLPPAKLPTSNMVALPATTPSSDQRQGTANSDPDYSGSLLGDLEHMTRILNYADGFDVSFSETNNLRIDLSPMQSEQGAGSVPDGPHELGKSTNPLSSLPSADGGTAMTPTSDRKSSQRPSKQEPQPSAEGARPSQTGNDVVLAKGQPNAACRHRKLPKYDARGYKLIECFQSPGDTDVSDLLYLPSFTDPNLPLPLLSCSRGVVMLDQKSPPKKSKSTMDLRTTSVNTTLAVRPRTPPSRSTQRFSLASIRHSTPLTPSGGFYSPRGTKSKSEKRASRTPSLSFKVSAFRESPARSATEFLGGSGKDRSTERPSTSESLMSRSRSTGGGAGLDGKTSRFSCHSVRHENPRPTSLNFESSPFGVGEAGKVDGVDETITEERALRSLGSHNSLRKAKSSSAQKGLVLDLGRPEAGDSTPHSSNFPSIMSPVSQRTYMSSLSRPASFQQQTSGQKLRRILSMKRWFSKPPSGEFFRKGDDEDATLTPDNNLESIPNSDITADIPQVESQREMRLRSNTKSDESTLDSDEEDADSQIITESDTEKGSLRKSTPILDYAATKSLRDSSSSLVLDDDNYYRLIANVVTDVRNLGALKTAREMNGRPPSRTSDGGFIESASPKSSSCSLSRTDEESSGVEVPGPRQSSRHHPGTLRNAKRDRSSRRVCFYLCRNTVQHLPPSRAKSWRLVRHQLSILTAMFPDDSSARVIAHARYCVRGRPGDHRDVEIVMGSLPDADEGYYPVLAKTHEHQATHTRVFLIVNEPTPDNPRQSFNVTDALQTLPIAKNSLMRNNCNSTLPCYISNGKLHRVKPILKKTQRQSTSAADNT